MIVVLDSALSSVFGTADSLVASVSTVQFLMCCAASIVLGAAVACIYMFRHKYSKNFVVTLALLPLIVQMVITLVNGNLGAGIAVMGVFNLLRQALPMRSTRRSRRLRRRSMKAPLTWTIPSATLMLPMMRHLRPSSRCRAIRPACRERVLRRARMAWSSRRRARTWCRAS